MYGLGGLEQVEVVKRRRKAKWLEEKKKEKEEEEKEEEKEKTKDRSVPDGSDKHCTLNSNHPSWQFPPQLVPDNELGKVFGAVAVCGDLANVAGTLLANSLYSPLRF